MVVDDCAIKGGILRKSLVAVENFMVDDRVWRTFSATLLNGTFRTLD